MATERIIPGEIRIFLNHIYEFKKGVRNMVLYTMSKEHEEFAIRRLKNQKISYMIQEVGTNKINLFFGKAECMEAMRPSQKIISSIENTCFRNFSFPSPTLRKCVSYF